ncbi:hypothetical protein GMORB2_4988, partial [Geosmithia morbida]
MQDDGVFRIISQGVNSGKLPDFPNSVQSTVNISVIDFWLYHGNNKHVRCKKEIVPPNSQEEFLNKRVGDDGESLLFRLVWATADSDYPENNLSRSIRERVLGHFGLGFAYQYANTFFSGITSLSSERLQDSYRQAHVFCYKPNMGAVWSHTVPKGDKGFTECLVMSHISGNDSPEKGAEQAAKSLEKLYRLLSSIAWDPNLCRSAAFPAYLFSLMLGMEMDATMYETVMELRTIESMTGHHSYKHRKNWNGAGDPGDQASTAGQDGDGAGGVAASSAGKAYIHASQYGHHGEAATRKRLEADALAELSSEVPGHATKLASVRRKAKVVKELLDFIKAMSGDDEKLMRDNAGVLQQRLEMQKMEAQHLRERVEIQIQAVFHLISKNDYMDNLEVANQNKRISESMKALAIVTMFFLPGSFVSALFSTPCFNWDTVDERNFESIGVGVTPQFWLYWSLTAPLTALTFIVYACWLWIQHEKEVVRLRAGGIGNPAPPTMMSQLVQAPGI